MSWGEMARTGMERRGMDASLCMQGEVWGGERYSERLYSNFFMKAVYSFTLITPVGRCFSNFRGGYFCRLRGLVLACAASMTSAETAW